MWLLVLTAAGAPKSVVAMVLGVLAGVVMAGIWWVLQDWMVP